METMEMTATEAERRFRVESRYRDVDLDDYTPLIESVGEIKLRVDEDEYQGDSYILLVKDGRWGYLNFGWGSCSGCDALQSCSTWGEVATLRNSLARETHWEDNPAALLRWMDEHDWEGDYVWNEPDFRQFLDEARALLAAET